MAIRNHISRFVGGLDTETPDTQLRPGRLIDSLNYEVGIRGGYRDIDGYRHAARPLPGEETPVQGLFVLQERIYAVKDGSLYRLNEEARTGPEAVWDTFLTDFGESTWMLLFDDAEPGIAPGDTLTGSTGGGTFTVHTVHYNIGAVAAQNGTPAVKGSGYIVATSLTGAFADNEELEDSNNVKQCLVNGPVSTVLLPVTGRMSWDSAVFGRNHYAYMAFGAGHAMQFDGEHLIPVVLDYNSPGSITPQHVLVNEARLLLSYDSSLFVSGTGRPLSFTSADGGLEVAVGDVITAMRTEPSTQGQVSASIFSHDRVNILSTDQLGNPSIHPYRTEIGAIPFSAQTAAETVFADEWGIRVLSVSEAFGNFSHTTITKHVQKRWEDAIKNRTVAGSLISRRKNQYRIFFDDGFGFHVTLRGRRTMGVMPVKIPDRPACFLSSEFESFGERIFMGTTTGGVFEMDVGRDFRGETIDCGLVTRMDDMRTSGLHKNIFDIQLEGMPEGTFDLNVMVIPDYHNNDGLFPLRQSFRLQDDGTIGPYLDPTRFPDTTNYIPPPPVNPGEPPRPPPPVPAPDVRLAVEVGMTVPINIPMLNVYGENVAIAIGRSSRVSYPVTWSGYRIRHEPSDQVVDRFFRPVPRLFPSIIRQYVSLPPGDVELPRAPSRPGAPALTVLGAESIRVGLRPPADWGIPGTPLRYTIYYAISSIGVFLSEDVTGPNVVAGTPLSHVLSDLRPNTEYEIRYSAVNAGGLISDQSEGATATTQREVARGFGVSG